MVSMVRQPYHYPRNSVKEIQNLGWIYPKTTLSSSDMGSPQPGTLKLNNRCSLDFSPCGLHCAQAML